LFRRQEIQILFGKEHVPALVPAAGGTTGTGKEKPVTIKRPFCHYSRSLNFSPNPVSFEPVQNPLGFGETLVSYFIRAEGF
jgi:hypothetical protein